MAKAKAKALGPIRHQDRLSLVGHLDELRTRLMVSALAFTAAFSLCFWQNDRVLEVIGRPLERSALTQASSGDDPFEQTARFQRETARALGRAAGAFDRLARSDARRTADRKVLAGAAQALRAASRLAPDAKRRPVTLGVGEPFFATLTMSGYAALLLSLPLLLYQLFAFVLPAFRPDERRLALPLMALAPLLFLAGVTFAYFVVLPPAIDFLQNFNDDRFDILVQARDYYRFTIMGLIGMGILFELPVAVLVVTSVGILTTRQLRKGRGYAILGLAVLAMIATPDPSPITMLFALAPLVVLYELSILLAALVHRRSERTAAGESSVRDDSDIDRNGS